MLNYFVDLLFVALFIEFLFYNYRRKGFAAYTHFEFCTECCIFCIYKCHCDAFVDRYCMIASSDMADYFVIGIQYLITVARYCTVLKFDTDKFTFYAFCFLCCNSVFSDKIRFVKFHENTKTGFYRCYVIGKFISIEGESNLKTQCVAATQATWFNTTGGYQCVPYFLRCGIACINLETIFSGITGPAYDNLITIIFIGGETVELEIGNR